MWPWDYNALVSLTQRLMTSEWASGTPGPDGWDRVGWSRRVDRIPEPRPFRRKRAEQWERLEPPAEPPRGPLGCPCSPLGLGSMMPLPLPEPWSLPQRAPQEDPQYTTVVFTSQTQDSKNNRTPSQRPLQLEPEYSEIKKT